MSLGRFSKRIRHQFSDQGLLEQALTHRSAGSPHNERLEFLGDAILNFVIAEELYRRFASAREGELTRLRATLVRGATLSALARELELGAHLRLGSGELKSGGRERDSILADGFEALVGAIYQDGGMQACRQFIGDAYERTLSALSLQRATKDPKTRLQEWLQSRQMPLPDYSVLVVEGAAHHQKFTVECRISELGLLTQGEGGSRRKAEQDAAEKALVSLTRG
ncbi:MAG: ribonuclease III [Gammaproteobacteria bacterium]|nr:ribonuclease III [Gammaproteobacteria bacterium]MDJ0871314.1 ribonuclease III [Gammaproteobacteria bacterium]